MSIPTMSEKANLYIILGMSSNNVIECLVFEGYDSNDVYYYIMENHDGLAQSHPFIHKIIVSLVSIYKKQYKMDPNLSNFKTLVDTSDEFGNDFIKITECLQKNTINACSYYQNNKKTVTLKSDLSLKAKTISLKDVTNMTPDANISKIENLAKPEIKVIIPNKVAIKGKIEIKKKNA
jgi:hypothetical protein